MQERQFPQAPSHNSDPAVRAARRRLRVRSMQAVLLATGSLSLLFVSTGCPEPADLNNAGTFTGGGASTGGTGGGAAGGASCDADPCIAKAFGPVACALCHMSKGAAEGGLQSAGLDLQSPNPSTRLKNVAAKHTDLPMTMNTGCPTGDFLVDVNNPGNSWLWKKINGGDGTCGDPMPQTGVISPTDKMCLQKFIECMAGKPITATGGTGGGGAGGASGGGGAGGASGGGGAGGGGGKAGGGGGGAGGTGGGGAGGTGGGGGVGGT